MSKYFIQRDAVFRNLVKDNVIAVLITMLKILTIQFGVMICQLPPLDFLFITAVRLRIRNFFRPNSSTLTQSRTKYILLKKDPTELRPALVLHETISRFTSVFTGFPHQYTIAPFLVNDTMFSICLHLHQFIDFYNQYRVLFLLIKLTKRLK